ncbi:MAG TPA: hypothetical protein VF531_13595 [Bacillota bacterium]
MSIIWDEKNPSDMNSDEIIKKLIDIYSEYQQELAATSSPGNGSIFIGMATENDTELIKGLLNLPSELRYKLWDFICANSIPTKPGTIPRSTDSKDTNTTKEQSIKELLLNSPHKEIEILIDHPAEK